MKLDDFTKAYIEAALWSTTGDNDEPLDEKYGIEDIDPETLDKIKADCKKFQEQNKELLNKAYELYSENEWSPEDKVAVYFKTPENLQIALKKLEKNLILEFPQQEQQVAAFNLSKYKIAQS